MISAKDIHPSAFYIAWGWSQSECLKILTQDIEFVSDIYISVLTPINGSLRRIDLYFENDRLIGVTHILCESIDFWDYDENIDEEREKVVSEFKRFYENTIEDYLPELGKPTLSGVVSEITHTDYSLAEHITFWDIDGERFQLEYIDQDRELPIMINISLCPKDWWLKNQDSEHTVP